MVFPSRPITVGGAVGVVDHLSNSYGLLVKARRSSTCTVLSLPTSSANHHYHTGLPSRVHMGGRILVHSDRLVLTTTKIILSDVQHAFFNAHDISSVSNWASWPIFIA